MLAHRGLIKVSKPNFEHYIAIVELTLEGYDLGRQCSSLMGQFQHFCGFRGHWLLVGMASFGSMLFGAVVREIASVVSKYFTSA